MSARFLAKASKFKREIDPFNFLLDLIVLEKSNRIELTHNFCHIKTELISYMPMKSTKYQLKISRYSLTVVTRVFGALWLLIKIMVEPIASVITDRRDTYSIQDLNFGMLLLFQD